MSLRGADAGGPAREGAAALLDVARGRGAGVGEAGRRWAVLERREKEDEDTREGVESGKEDPLPLFIREWIDGMRGNRGG